MTIDFGTNLLETPETEILDWMNQHREDHITNSNLHHIYSSLVGFRALQNICETDGGQITKAIIGEEPFKIER